MVEDPQFDYHYDLAFRKSFAARLSISILVIAAGVFLVAMLTYLYFFQESVKEESAVRARTQLHDAVMNMRLKSAESMLHNDSLPLSFYTDILRDVKPYKHSVTLLTNDKGELLFVSDSTLVKDFPEEFKSASSMINHPEAGMKEIFKGSKLSLLIHEPVQGSSYFAALICTRMDILSSYNSLIFYGLIAFILGLLILFACSAYAIHRMVVPLQSFAGSALSIASGNLDTPLPEITSKDELYQLRESFKTMQTSLKEHIADLQQATSARERLQSELTIAHDIQMGMLPKSFPERDDIDLFALMNPAKEVGGDLYDFVIDGDQLFFIIGDVAGKGVPASLYMAVTRTLFRNHAGNYQSAANMVREINHAISVDNDTFLFVTLFVGILDMKTRLLTFCNAAHNAPILFTPEGTCDFLKCEANLPVGVEDHFAYEDEQISFEPGSALFLYTDGLTEADNGHHELYGNDQLLADSRKCTKKDAHDVISYFVERVKEHANGAEQNDDLTMLFLRNLDSDSKKFKGRVITLKNEISEIARLRSFIFAICTELGTSTAYIKSVYLAIEEMVTNVINYAYPKGLRGHVHIGVRKEKSSLVFTIKDHGAPFDPTQTEAPDTTSGLEDRQIGGLGIFLARQMMDSINYSRSEDGYNVLELRKHL